MLLDQCLPESVGDAIIARVGVAALVVLALAAVRPTGAAAQGMTPAERLVAFERDHPELHAQVVGTTRAHGVLYGALARGRGRVREAETFGLMMRRTSPGAQLSRPDPEAEAGYAVLGARGAEVIRRTQAFQLEVLAILATVAAAERTKALDEAADRYLSRPEVSLPDVAKDMTVLYDHPYSSIVVPVPGAPKRKTPRLKGFVWAAAWFQLAAEEPLELSTGADRARGLELVTSRFRQKLAYGKPPQTFPSELPLAPSIAPELVTTHLRTAAIIDNLNLMHAVLADVLEHPKVVSVRAALDEVVAQFVDPTYRVVDVDDWIRMALRHSIFEQGGPAIGVMTVSDRNGSGHLQHLGGGRGILPGMK